VPKEEHVRRNLEMDTTKFDPSSSSVNFVPQFCSHTSRIINVFLASEIVKQVLFHIENKMRGTTTR